MKLISIMFLVFSILTLSVYSSDKEGKIDGDTGAAPKTENGDNRDSGTPLDKKTDVNLTKENSKDNSVELVKEEITKAPELSGDVSLSYSVQIGAFNTEENATVFTENARTVLNNKDIYYTSVDGQYKIRLGKYSSLEEAAVMLNKIFNTGWTDIFVVEVNAGKK